MVLSLSGKGTVQHASCGVRTPVGVFSGTDVMDGDNGGYSSSAEAMVVGARVGSTS